MNCVAEVNRLSLTDFNSADCLIYGIGNVGRQDDGLGWAFIDWIEAQGLCSKAETVRNYQLFLEDADLISRKKRVLFVDATKDMTVEHFALYQEQAKLDFSFTSHAISIAAIMATCQLCFDRQPDVYVLAIRGYEWALQEGLTEHAQVNLDQAVLHFSKSD
ncbi:hydrogenase maturation protease [Amphritea sp. 1_MG-2023]|uniref:hydrogenase maturation protease n=1 Tax=Amphritea sp. 1_MG-2023 TaxID=3062670 RepID=UPI0026E194B8|nr:hydrogenase maturation protease [Amphritea sp. 1_MG-2023]MDO6563331.1 hydrogenase maturation protease [Amphritea sp. 1_MG-2023]